MWPITWNEDPSLQGRRDLTAGLQPIAGRQLRVQPGGGARVQLVPGGHAGIGARQPRRFLLAGHVGRPVKVRAFQEPAYRAELLALTQLAAPRAAPRVIERNRLCIPPPRASRASVADHALALLALT